MPKTSKVYPDWVQEYWTKDTTVKKKGESYISAERETTVTLAHIQYGTSLLELMRNC